MKTKKILIYDLHASESGALAILLDFYNEIQQRNIADTHWSFIISTPHLEQNSNMSIHNYPWVKKSWIHRLCFEYFYEKKIIKKESPDILFSLQNIGVANYKGRQIVYLHLPFILTDYRFTIRKDGLKLWLYQHILKYKIFTSFRYVEKIIVQTQWMKKALAQQANIPENKILIVPPKIENHYVSKYIDKDSTRKVFFFPATAFAYKNHITILKACTYLKEKGIHNFKVIFTIGNNKKNNRYVQYLSAYIKNNNLEDNIEFCGMLSREKTFEIYTESVLLFPSLVESFGLPLLEARLSQSIIIAAKTPFSIEILHGYPNAHYFDGTDYTQLATLMQQTINKELQYIIDSDNISQFSNSQSIVDIINSL